MWRVIASLVSSAGLLVAFLVLYPSPGAGAAAGSGPAQKTTFEATSGGCPVPATINRASAVPAAGGSPYDAPVQGAFTARFPSPGVAVLQGRAGALDVEKRVLADGRVRIELRTGDELVQVVLGQTSLDVTNGSAKAHVEIPVAEDDDMLVVKRVLAGSKAVRLLRVLALNIPETSLQTPVGVGTLLTDALVGYLDGDVGAIDRVAKRFARRTQAKLRRVALEDEKGCWEKYEAEVVRAYDDYMLCLTEVPQFLHGGCRFRWALWAESAWFSFLSCSAFPWKME